MTRQAAKSAVPTEPEGLRYSCVPMPGSASRWDRRRVGALVWLAALLLTFVLGVAGLEARAAAASDETSAPAPSGSKQSSEAAPETPPAEKPAPGAAEAGSGEVLVPVQASPDDAPPRQVELDDLLRLPQGFSSDVERRGGVTRSEWLARFSGARQELADAKKKLVDLNGELDKVSQSSSSWQVSAPGSADPQTSPLSLRLRQDIKAQRTRIEEAERRLRALDVEADLAAVPASWRE